MTTVFFDIDTQNDFIMPYGNLYVPDADKLIPNFIKLMRIASDKGIRIVSSVDAHPFDDPEFNTFPPHCIKGESGWEKIPETILPDNFYIENLENADDGGLSAQQIIFEKTVFSMFGNPNTGRILEELDITRAIVFGVATDYCVKAAALGLVEKGYETLVIEDAIAAVTPETGADAIIEMKSAGVVFIKTEDVENEM